jgi:GT2 family glycosyltransferase
MCICDVILPVFNNDSTVVSAATSILKQTCSDLRLLVLDDGSTDHSLALLREFDDPRIEIVENSENAGLPIRLNQAVGMVEAPYVARMDADDIAHPERLERQIATLENDDSLDLVGCWVVTIDEDDTLIGCRRFPTDHDEIIARPYRSILMAHPAWCGRAEWFKANPYNPADVKAQDQALLLRSRKSSRFGNIPEFLLAYRESTALRPMTKLRTRLIIARNIRSIASSEGHSISGLVGSAGVLARWSLDVLAWVARDPNMAGHRFEDLTDETAREWEEILVHAMDGLET